MCNHDYKNFNTLFIYCRDCKNTEAYYDKVHDEIFCKHCGKIIRMQVTWLNF